MPSKTKKFKSGIVGYDFISAFGGYSIIKNEHPLVYKNILKVIKAFAIQDSEILAPGGNESVITQRLKKEFLNLKWHVEVIAHKLNHFEVQQGKDIIKDYAGKPFKIVSEALSHKMDAFHNDKYGNVALEIEWNTRKEFLERDITAFQSLYENGYIDAAIVIIKDEELQKVGIPRIYKNYFNSFKPKSLKDLQKASKSEITKSQSKEIVKQTKSKSWADACANVLVKNKFGGTHSHFGNLQTLIDQGKVRLPLLILNINEKAIRGKYI